MRPVLMRLFWLILLLALLVFALRQVPLSEIWFTLRHLKLSARWDKARRFALAWQALERIRPQRWITHRFPAYQAVEAYRLLDEHP
ncbi:MAG: hypothetical protein ACP5QU_09705, partial [Anaerolineae bacterium]